MKLKKLFLPILAVAFIGGMVFAVLFNQSHKDGWQVLMSSLMSGHHQQATQDTSFNLWQASIKPLDSPPLTLEDINADAPLIIVNFWATWCPPCVKEMALLDKANADGKIKIIGLTYEDDATVQPFLKDYPVDYTIARIHENDIDGLFQYIRENGNATASLPFTILLDNKGNIVRRRLGEFHSADEVLEFSAITL